MPAIGTLVEIGPALKVNLGDLVDAERDPHLTQLEIPVRAVFDVNDGFAHQRLDLRAAPVAHRVDGQQLLAGACRPARCSATARSTTCTTASTPPYATADRPAYDARAGLIATRLNASLRHRISPTLRLQYFAQARDGARRGQRGQPAGAQQAGRGHRRQPDLGRLALRPSRASSEAERAPGRGDVARARAGCSAVHRGRAAAARRYIARACTAPRAAAVIKFAPAKCRR